MTLADLLAGIDSVVTPGKKLQSMGHDAVSPSDSKWWTGVGNSWTFFDPQKVKVLGPVE